MACDTRDVLKNIISEKDLIFIEQSLAFKLKRGCPINADLDKALGDVVRETCDASKARYFIKKYIKELIYPKTIDFSTGQVYDSVYCDDEDLDCLEAYDECWVLELIEKLKKRCGKLLAQEYHRLHEITNGNPFHFWIRRINEDIAPYKLRLPDPDCIDRSDSSMSSICCNSPRGGILSKKRHCTKDRVKNAVQFDMCSTCPECPTDYCDSYVKTHLALTCLIDAMKRSPQISEHKRKLMECLITSFQRILRRRMKHTLANTQYLAEEQSLQRELLLQEVEDIRCYLSYCDRQVAHDAYCAVKDIPLC